MIFTNRIDAGQRLAKRLESLRGQDAVVLGLPRGGVPVAAQVAAALGASLDVVVVRKLGVPGNEELAMGAVGDGVRIVHDDIVESFGIGAAELRAVELKERRELDRRLRRFRGRRPAVELSGRTVVIVDDGIATGATAMAACEVVRAAGPARIVVAVPVGPPHWGARQGLDADELVCLERPPHFFSIGQWYHDFAQTSDDEVAAWLDGGA